MKLIKTESYQALSRQAANMISAQVILKPGSVLGLATGSTPIGLYSQLAEWCAKGDIDFSQARTVNLDEYVGLDSAHEQSYRHFMDKYLFSKININLENTHVPIGTAPDLTDECARYDALIETLGGIDMQLLGIGHNGHIGFNEPGGAFERTTHVVDLLPSTIAANARFFASSGEVPKQALTIGMKSIMLARKILLVASGREKTAILEKALNGPITPDVPASILQLHADLTVVICEND
jgi:glucosamine-6-phosphate deaminase